MANYQNYRRYRNQGGDGRQRVGKAVLLLAAFLFIYLIARAIFGSDKNTSILNTLNEPLANVGSANTANNINGIVNGAINGNNNSNTNTNVNASPSASSSTFSVASNCAAVKSRGSETKKAVALTFNVGTIKEGSIDAVLTGLKNGSVPAAFFATGDVASGNAALVKKIADANFPVYNFGNSLVKFTDLQEAGITEQLTKAEASISAVTGVSTKPFFRPPYNAVDDTVLATVKKDGYCPVVSTFDALDWSADSTAASSKERVLSKASNGSIILMQASNSITAEILPDVISGLKAKGFTFVSLDALLASSS